MITVAGRHSAITLVTVAITITAAVAVVVVVVVVVGRRWRQRAVRAPVQSVKTNQHRQHFRDTINLSKQNKSANQVIYSTMRIECLCASDPSTWISFPTG